MCRLVILSAPILWTKIEEEKTQYLLQQSEKDVCLNQIKSDRSTCFLIHSWANTPSCMCVTGIRCRLKTTINMIIVVVFACIVAMPLSITILCGTKHIMAILFIFLLFVHLLHRFALSRFNWKWMIFFSRIHSYIICEYFQAARIFRLS